MAKVSKMGLYYYTLFYEIRIVCALAEIYQVKESLAKLRMVTIYYLATSAY